MLTDRTHEVITELIPNQVGLCPWCSLGAYASSYTSLGAHKSAHTSSGAKKIPHTSAQTSADHRQFHIQAHRNLWENIQVHIAYEFGSTYKFGRTYIQAFECAFIPIYLANLGKP